MRILVVEDEAPMRRALVETLSAEGYRVRSAANGPDGLDMALAETFDLVLLDVMMPGLDGYAVCRALRERGRGMPVLMLTAKAMVDDRVEGLDAGADDYLVKPFSLRELLARVRALLRRRDRDNPVPEEIAVGSAVIHFSKQVLVRDGIEHALSAKEFGMLRLLASRAGEVITREQFLDQIWEYNAYPSTRTVDNFINSLRAKLEPDPSNPRHLLTVRGAGYRLVP